ncbi:DMT family transporter [Sporolactobacillus sp. Y61]|uniref:DMT family transporter n=1 Tax=Sporolactobacillus sp. Y61 TaxID=3160863 RepID=A0AAU8IIF9_9BACL
MSQRRADLLLVLATAMWGSSYLFMKSGLETLDVFNLIALRFLIAFLVTAALFCRELRHTDRHTLFCSMILAINLCLVFTGILYGLKSTSAAKAGFLVALTVVFVPLLNFVLFRKKPGMNVSAGACLSLTGIGFLTWNGQFLLQPGDLLCILGALANASYILLTDHFTKRVNTICLGVWQMGFAGIFALTFSFLIETPHLPSGPDAWLSVLGLAILCSAAGYMLQTVAQKYTVPAHASLIFSLEPVFAALFAFIFMGEALPARGTIGAAIILSGIMIMEVDPWKYFHPRPMHANR